MKFIRSNSLSLKVSKVDTISRLQNYRDENIRVSDKKSVTLGRFLLDRLIKGNNILIKKNLKFK